MENLRQNSFSSGAAHDERRFRRHTHNQANTMLKRGGGGRMVSRRGSVVACQMTLKDFETIGMIQSCAAAYKEAVIVLVWLY